ncbi:MAG: 30S ribosomal protein S12 methylthiotransferase RimO [Alphaproteobacteria bacterium]|nr:30S ribosomal protein S12 methylthiotransferase RimO [Alphaproteobacteria bacterium]MBP7759135.1 30S ribosomal protein S12 methylthiotransferase RimO [Alphaproteobacteria bacterium]MBP7762499.1 30S ribosomal protein S12 methylthiotransferase RimO [Alphaproteobacteria bacterium]MBP7905729.1 30S ribosomal protein S12 methylthiotransferase RimO [Alphaproteobacteria bacterium]
MKQAQKAPVVGMVSLGCPKALVDSERILTKLRADGYDFTNSYEGADVVVVNTCGFIDSAKEESLNAIGEALDANGRVIVTGCMGAEAETISERYPKLLAITGPHQYEQVVDAVKKAQPIIHNPFVHLVPEEGLKLTPKHYSYLKISEGCNNRCSFCIIPALRGDLVSRPIHRVLHEAEQLLKAGTKEILVISQDTSAYGVDLKYAESPWRGERIKTKFYDLCKSLGTLAREYGAWVRLHYVYPYPHVDDVIPLMAEGLILPYLDIPFQHASPAVLRAMKRPAAQEKTLDRIRKWREICPNLVLRSTFIVGFPGETEEDFEILLNWLEDAQIDRAGAFKYEAVDGAKANEIAEHIPEDEKQERWERFMTLQTEIAAAKAQLKIGQVLEVIIDEIGEPDEDGAIGADGRSKGDAPEIDGTVFIRDLPAGIKQGDIVKVLIEDAEDYDLFGIVQKP